MTLRQRNEFVPPPEAPVFEPTWEEFCDPLAYIDQIRPVGEKYGVVKIKPPPSWQPPFAVDVESFKFTPRIQKLNELEALSRVKLNFIDQLTKFWRLQGISLKLPLLDGKYVDMYSLQKIVSREGGFIEATRKESWPRISQLMGYSQGRGCEVFLSHHYEKVIHPYDLFLSGATLNAKKTKAGKAFSTSLGGVDGRNEANIKIEQQSFFVPMKTGKLKKMRRMASNQPCYQREDVQPAPVQVSSSPTKITINSLTTGEEEIKQESLFVSKVEAYADQYFCEVCDGGEDDSLMLLCDGCDYAYHTYCLVPPLEKVPPGDWMCPKCIAKECCRPMEAYGFEQSRVEYTLESFGTMADQFKANHFGVSPHLVSYTTCEKEFWRLVECLEEDVSVEYGADIHSGEQGSGFPTEKTKNQFLGYEEYITSGWNLNNLPVLDLSVLRHVSGDISGMMIPWCYVGMCFSSFSWHIEDHWSYSVNYMHWGEPKTWYGVPESHAKLLEQCMMKEVPELFRDSPDLLHQLTTIINPNVLMDYGVQVYRMDQCPGEFIITFPRSYHAGFNQGYNFAEAVNFCPPDWVRLGRECIEDYKRLKRQCVFSHDQLLCEMADKSKTLNLKMAAVVHDDLFEVVAKEAELRERANALGVTSMERFCFENHDDDDDRQCDVCKTTCYLSGVLCSLHPERLLCLQHDLKTEFKCDCPTSNHVLRFRHTMDELYSLVEALRVRSLSLDVWKAKVVEVLQPSTNQHKPDVSYLKELIAVVTDENLPKDDLVLQKLKDKVINAESCVESARELMNKKDISRQQKVLEAFLHMHSMTILQQQQQHPQLQQQFFGSRVTIGELRLFCERVKDLPCSFKEADLIQDFLENVLVLQREVSTTLSSDSMPSTGRLQELVDWSANLDVEFPELIRLHQLLVQSRWLSEYNTTFSHHNELNNPEMKLNIFILKKLCASMLANFQASLHPLYLSASTRVRALLSSSESVERKADLCLKDRPVIGTIEALIEESNALSCVSLPNVSRVRELLVRANQWQELATMQMGRGHGLHLDELDYLIELGMNIPVRFESLPSFQTRLKLAVQWKQKVFLTFFHGSRKSILQPWFSEVGISLDSNYPRRKEVVFSKDGTFSCPNSPITLTSLQTVVKATVEKLISSRNTDTKKLLENGKATSNNSTCSCGRSFTDHVRCCVLCTIIYQADCCVLQNNSNHHLSTSSNQVPASKSNNIFGESPNKIGLLNASPFGFPSSNAPLIGFQAANQGLFSTSSLPGTAFNPSTMLSGPNQLSSFPMFGTANGSTVGMFSTNRNQFSNVAPVNVNNQNQSVFQPNNSGTNLFQWTTNQNMPTLQAPFTSTNIMGGNVVDQTSSNCNVNTSNATLAHLCPTCKASNGRPAYEELKGLVAGWYNMSGICMPEGRALIYLDNLVNEWQQKARKVIACRELVVATGLLDLPSIESKDDQPTSGFPIPESIFRLSSDAILRPRLMILDVSVGLQAQLSDLLVEMLALNIETQECRLIRSLLYACYEKIVLTEALKKEEEARRQAKLEEERQKKLEEAERLRKAAEEKKKREEEEARKRKLEEEEYKRRMEEENRRRKLAEEEQRKKREKQLQLQQQQQQQQQLLQQQQQLLLQQQQLQQQQKAEKESLERKRKFSQMTSSEEHNEERALKMKNDSDKRRPDIKSPDDKKKHSTKNMYTDSGSGDDAKKTKLSAKNSAKTATPKSDKHSKHHAKSTPLKSNSSQPASNLSALKNFLTNDNSDDSSDDQSSIQAWKSLGSGKQKITNPSGKHNSGDRKNKPEVKKKPVASSGHIYTDDESGNEIESRRKKQSKEDGHPTSSKKSKKIQSTKKHKKDKKKKKGDDDDDDDNDNELFGEEEEDAPVEDLNSSNTWEVCSSKTCLKPIGAKVDWVQCDRCEQWYHLVCVDLLELPDEDDDYVCPSCSKVTTPKHKNNNNNNAPKSGGNNNNNNNNLSNNKNKKHDKNENKHHKNNGSNSTHKHQKLENKSKITYNTVEEKSKPAPVTPKLDVIKNKTNSFSCAINDAASPQLKKKKKLNPTASVNSSINIISQNTSFTASTPMKGIVDKNHNSHKNHSKSYVSDLSDDSDDDDADSDDVSSNEDDDDDDDEYSGKNRQNKTSMKEVGKQRKDLKPTKESPKKKNKKSLSCSSSSSSSYSAHHLSSSHHQPSSSAVQQNKRPWNSPKKQQKSASKSRLGKEDDDDEDDDDDDDDRVNDDSERDSEDSGSRESNRQHNSNIDSYLYTPWLNKS